MSGRLLLLLVAAIPIRAESPAGSPSYLKSLNRKDALISSVLDTYLNKGSHALLDSVLNPAPNGADGNMLFADNHNNGSASDDKKEPQPAPLSLAAERMHGSSSDSDSDHHHGNVQSPSPQVIYVQDLSLGFIPYLDAFSIISEILLDYRYLFPDTIFQFATFKDGEFCDESNRSWCYEKHVGWTSNLNAVFGSLEKQVFSSEVGDRDGALDALYRVPIFARLPNPSTRRTPAIMIFSTDGHLQYDPTQVQAEDANMGLAEPSCLTTGPKLSLRQLALPFKSRFILPVVITSLDGDLHFWHKFVNEVGAGQIVAIAPGFNRAQVTSAIGEAMYNVTMGLNDHLPYAVGEESRGETMATRSLFPGPLPDQFPNCDNTTTTTAMTTLHGSQPLRTYPMTLIGNASAINSTTSIELDMNPRAGAATIVSRRSPKLVWAPEGNSSHGLASDGIQLDASLDSAARVNEEETTAGSVKREIDTGTIVAISSAAVGAVVLVVGVAGVGYRWRSSDNQEDLGEELEDLERREPPRPREGGERGVVPHQITLSPRIDHGDDTRRDVLVSESVQRQREEQELIDTWFA